MSATVNANVELHAWASPLAEVGLAEAMARAALERFRTLRTQATTNPILLASRRTAREAARVRAVREALTAGAPDA